MGFALTNYSIFQALSNDQYRYGLRSVKESLDKFNLFVIIIHNPVAHDEFSITMQRSFDELDCTTGEQLLFLTLVNPEPEWRRKTSKRQYIGALTELEARELFRSSNAFCLPDPSLGANALALKLNIQIENLPCIVITNDFSLKEYIWLKTSPQHIHRQLNYLGYLAHDRYDSIHDLNLDEINFCSGVGERKLIESLAKALSDVLAFITFNDERDKAHVEDSVKESLNDLLRTLRSLKENPRDIPNDEDEHGTFSELCVRLCTFLSLLISHERFPHRGFIEIDNRFLEPDSQMILKTGSIVAQAIHSHHFDGILRAQELDFTPPLVCLSKVFENEIDLSVVHWIRAALGIELPEFFNKPKPNFRATVIPDVPNPRGVNFNKSSRGILNPPSTAKWIPPSIGESELAYEKYLNENRCDLWENSEREFLKEKWFTIAEFRNRSTHRAIIEYNEYLQVKNTLAQLADRDYFSRFHELKELYRPHQ